MSIALIFFLAQMVILGDGSFLGNNQLLVNPSTSGQVIPLNCGTYIQSIQGMIVLDEADYSAGGNGCKTTYTNDRTTELPIDHP